MAVPTDQDFRVDRLAISRAGRHPYERVTGRRGGGRPAAEGFAGGALDEAGWLGMRSRHEQSAGRRYGGTGRARLLLVAAVAPLLVACVVATGGGFDSRPPEPVPSPGPGELRTVPLMVLEVSGSTLALVPVTISGQGPYMFALDTGASTTVLDTAVADELGLTRTGEQQDVVGVIGGRSVDLARVDQWRLGDVTLDAADIALLDLPSPAPGRDDVLQGLLGSDVLSDFDYVVVDYDDRRLGLAGV